MSIPTLPFFSFLVSLLMGNVATAAPQAFVIDPAHTYATFEVGHLGISTQRGRLGQAAGTAMLDGVQGVGDVAITLDARSLSTGSEPMEKLLRGSSWFAVEQHPTIAFNASSISFVAQKPTRIEGVLTLRGVSRPISLTVTHYACTRLPFGVRLTCGMDAQAMIKRSDFGMDSLLAFVGDEVKLLIQAEAVRQEPAPLELRP
jgi:polyisoprenoid-binding protein YceI